MRPSRAGRPAAGADRVPDEPTAGVRTLRLLVGAAGLAAGAYGGWLLWAQRDDAPSLGLWLAAGVLLHDAVLAPLLVAGGLLLARVLPPAWRAPVAVAVIVWGSLTLLAIPVLGEFGALPDNPTLLDRPYLATWAVLTAVTAALVTAAALARRSRRVAR